MNDFPAETSLEGIAIIGMHGRFPGAADLDQFWQNLRHGVESITFFSDEQVNSAGLQRATPAPKNVRAGGILDGIDLFDSAFFGFRPSEAEMMDPQYRLFLETAWSALEDSGYDSQTYEGVIGVYAGMNMNRYLLENILPHRDIIESAGLLQIRILNDKDFLASLTSYKLNLKGPSISVQTACSTSLVAISLACQSLLNYQSDLVLAGGVSVSPSPTGYYVQEGVYASDGHCRAFDAKAQGTVGGDGVGVVVLKRLEEAVADGDHIYAVIKGWGINNDGAGKVSYSAPGLDGQFEVIAMAQSVAGVDPESISYIEAHGTGTPLGDPIEVEALTQVFRTSTQETGFCALGSVKTNIGHLDAAAGVASLIKTVLSLQHQMIPPSLHFETPNPQIDFAHSPFYINTTLSEWKSGKTPRRAGVSSFAMGGTNAHIIVEEAPPRSTPDSTKPAHLLVLSARTDSALEAATNNLVAYLKQHPEQHIADVAYTLQVGRKAFNYRRTLLCAEPSQAVQALETRDPKRVRTGVSKGRERPITFMFPGLGNHYTNMARALYDNESVFKQHVDECCTLLKHHLGLDLREKLYPDQYRPEHAASPTDQRLDFRRMVTAVTPDNVLTQELNQTLLSQPAIFVVEYALAQLLMHWGIQPQSMIGYSIGEYVAACIAGVFTLQDALRLVARRAILIESLPQGAMLAVELTESEVQQFLSPALSLAAVNGSAGCVLAGSEDVIEQVARQLSQYKQNSRRLATAHAFHSSMMEPILGRFVDLVQTIDLQVPRIPFISNVTGTWISDTEATDPQYWGQHLCRTVRFGDGISELWKELEHIFLEVGPGQALSAWTLQHPAIENVTDPVVFSTLRYVYDQQHDSTFLLNTLAQLWLAGVPVDWQTYQSTEKRQRVPLPTYPFERQRYWLEPGMLPAVERPVSAEVTRTMDMADWFWLPIWKQSPASMPHQTLSVQSWLCLLDECEVSTQLHARLADAGHRIVGVRVGAAFRRDGEQEYTINPSRREDYEMLVQELKAQDKLPDQIIHAWTITSSQLPGMEELVDDQYSGLYSLMLLVQALTNARIAEPLVITTITSGVQLVTGDEIVRPAKATILGLSKVIPQEYTHITCRTIDIIPGVVGTLQAKRVTDQLIAELTNPSSDPVIAYRGPYRWVQSFEQTRLESRGQAQTVLRPRGVYLITGGLGGVGLVLAQYLAQTVQARLVLIGRSPFPGRDEWERWLASHGEENEVSRKIHQLLACEQLGADVLILSADVTDQAAMRQVIAQTHQRFGAVNGVIHAAGVMPGGLIQVKTPTMMAEVLAPKVKGTLVLAEELRDTALDFFILCSSLNAVTGGFGLVDHCAANAFLDTFAHYNTITHSIPTLSINWDTWLEVGQAARAAATPASHAHQATHYEQLEPISHPLLNGRARGQADQGLYLTEFRADHHWIVDEHRMMGVGVVPGTAYIEMLRAAFAQQVGDGILLIQKMQFIVPLSVPDSTPIEARITLDKDGQDYAFSISSRPRHQDGQLSDWQEHVRGMLSAVDSSAARTHDIAAISARCRQENVDISAMWPAWTDDYISFGKRWSSLNKRVTVGTDEALMWIELPQEFASDLEAYSIHPAMLDAATGFVQTLAQGQYLPLAYEKILIKGRLPAKIYSYARSKGSQLEDQEIIICDISITDEDGIELIAIEDYTLRKVSPDSIRALVDMGQAQAVAQAQIDPVLNKRYSQSNPYVLPGKGISPQEGSEVFSRILSQGGKHSQIIISTWDLPELIKLTRSLTSERLLDEAAKARTQRPKHARTSLGKPYVAPRSELEQSLTTIWQELLRIDQIGVHDNFFDIGGDSLLATRLIGQLEEAFQIDLPLRALFEAPTVADMAMTIVSKQATHLPGDALSQMLADITQLSPDELEALLALEDQTSGEAASE